MERLHCAIRPGLAGLRGHLNEGAQAGSPFLGLSIDALKKCAKLLVFRNEPG